MSEILAWTLRIFIWALVFTLYFLPSLMAIGKKNLGGIFFLNLVFGWTFVVWIVCFIWACVSKQEYET